MSLPRLHPQFLFLSMPPRDLFDHMRPSCTSTAAPDAESRPPPVPPLLTCDLLVLVPALRPVDAEAQLVHVALPDLLVVVLELAPDIFALAGLLEVAANRHACLGGAGGGEVTGEGRTA